ncbi:MAG: HNH endonuclease, partial [Bacteroidales bacterium]|nr:HNH endonuclease [Bacteroidales bacterium]
MPFALKRGCEPPLRPQPRFFFQAIISTSTKEDIMRRYDRTSLYQHLVNTRRWRKLRLAILTERPLCEICLRCGYYKSAQEVHHVKPISTARTADEAERLAYDPANLMALCTECHHEAHRLLDSNSRESRKKRKKMECREAIRKFFGDDAANQWEQRQPPRGEGGGVVCIGAGG